MDWIILLLLLLLMALLSVWLDRRWQARAEITRPPQPLSTPRGDLLAQITSGWRQRLPWSKSAPYAAPLYTWLQRALPDDAAEKVWLNGLNPTQWQNVHDQLAAFCTPLGINLAWLGTPLLAQDPELEQAIGAIVLHGLHAHWQAAQVQADVQAFQVWWRMDQQPYSQEQQPLIRQFYTRLVEAGLTDPVRPEILLAGDKIRQQHLIEAIHTAAGRDQAAFKGVLQTFSNTPVTPAAPSAVAASTVAPLSANSQAATP